MVWVGLSGHDCQCCRIYWKRQESVILVTLACSCLAYNSTNSVFKLCVCVFIVLHFHNMDYIFLYSLHLQFVAVVSCCGQNCGHLGLCVTFFNVFFQSILCIVVLCSVTHGLTELYSVFNKRIESKCITDFLWYHIIVVILCYLAAGCLLWYLWQGTQLHWISLSACQKCNMWRNLLCSVHLLCVKLHGLLDRWSTSIQVFSRKWMLLLLDS